MTASFMIDFVTIAGFAVLSFLAFLLLDALMGGRRRAVAAGNLDVDLPVSGTRKAGFVKRTLASCIPQFRSETETIRRNLRRAGYYGATALDDYLATRNVFVLLTLGLFVSLAVVSETGGRMGIVLLTVGMILAALAYSLPRFAISRQAKARVARIERGLPDALDIVQMCLTGGLPLREALKHVAAEIRQTHPDIAVEFDIIRRQADAGSMAKALRNFADRIDAPDVNALASTVTQTERLGTEVAVAIAEFADRMRLAFRQRAEEKAGKTSVLLLFPIILCLVPPLLIAIAGPPLLKLRTFLIEARQPGGALDTSGAREQLEEAPDFTPPGRPPMTP